MAREAFAGISLRLEDYFRCHHQEALQAGLRKLACPPGAATIQAIMDAAFWASLRREEGYVPKISLAYLSMEQSCSPIVLNRPLHLGPEALARVSPAVEGPGIHLGVWGEGDLRVWGMTRSIPALCFVLEVAAPGLLVVKHHSGDESRKFRNVAVLEGDRVKMVDVSASAAAAGLLPADITMKLAVSMRSHGRGGLLLVVPSDNGGWRESLVQPMPYSVSAPSGELATIAGVTAVDGAVVLTDRQELLGFGAKIVRRKEQPQVEQILISEPVEGAVPLLVSPEQLGGTRHLAAAQFVHDQREAVALVASQDGRFTIFRWSAPEHMVHAHRLEALLF
jgi:hypothetical protein